MDITPYMLKHVDDERLMNYIIDKGWHEERFGRDEVLLFTRSGGEMYDILLPAREFLVDHDDMILRAMEMVAAFNGVGVDSVYKAIVSLPVVKKFIVDCCKHCPLKEIISHSHGVIICTHAKTYGMFIDDADLIPDWCELEDN